MKRCPLTYELLENDLRYSAKGLKKLSRNLKNLKDFGYSPEDQIKLAAENRNKISIAGVQPKLSLKLSVVDEEFVITEKRGNFILKPPQKLYEDLPANEDVTMRLAAIAEIEVPLHGLIYNIDSSLSYLIKRFDREGIKRIAQEDFSQLESLTRDTKYEGSMEKIAKTIEEFSTFPELEKIKLFRLVIFNFLTGNEDAHVKNFSLITRDDKVELSPAYDLVNTTIIITAKEEIALPLRGKKSNLKKDDLLVYYGKEYLKLSEKVIEKEIARFENCLGEWIDLLNISFLSEKMRAKYIELLKSRWNRLAA